MFCSLRHGYSSLLGQDNAGGPDGFYRNDKSFFFLRKAILSKALQRIRHLFQCKGIKILTLNVHEINSELRFLRLFQYR